MFHSLPEYLDWYVESCSVINKADAQDSILSESGYDPTMRQLLENLMDVYSPYRFVNKQQFILIYRSVMSCHIVFGEDDVNTGGDKDGLPEGLMSLYEGLFNNGQLCKPIGTKEMAERLGIYHRTLVAKLNKFTPPIQYAWKITKVRGDWRYDPMQIDNFKRWLANCEEEVVEGPDVTHMVKKP